MIVLVIVLALSNFWFFTLYIKYRTRVDHIGFLAPWPITPVSVATIGEEFEVNSLGPTPKAEVRLIGRGDLLVHGGTSDTEAWVLAVLSKKAKNIFEFGTCTGKTAYLMAANSPPEAQVVTLSLHPDQRADYSREQEDSSKAAKDALKESTFTEFLYNNTPVEKKIIQLFCDSKKLDPQPYLKKFDLIFIDGSHAYSYVMNDSQKALNMLAPGGVILWHDYRGPFEARDVYKALNQLAKKITLNHIKNTSLVVYQNN